MAKKSSPEPVSATSAELTDYVVLSPVDIDGERYTPGETLPIDATTAAGLIAAGAITAVPDAAPITEPSGGQTTE